MYTHNNTNGLLEAKPYVARNIFPNYINTLILIRSVAKIPSDDGDGEEGPRAHANPGSQDGLVPQLTLPASIPSTPESPSTYIYNNNNNNIIALTHLIIINNN